MVDLLEQLVSVTGIWQEEIVPRQWREGLIVNMVKKGDWIGRILVTTGVSPYSALRKSVLYDS